jgi:hypothetical protein
MALHTPMIQFGLNELRMVLAGEYKHCLQGG